MVRRRLTAGVCVLALAAALASFPQARSDERAWDPASLTTRFADPDAGAADDLYGENSECKECHQDRVKSLEVSFHARFGDARKSKSRGCQECHGPGQEHSDEEVAKLIRNPALVVDHIQFGATPVRKLGSDAGGVRRPTIAEINGTCLRCHATGAAGATKPGPLHEYRLQRTRNPSGERSCVSCHEIHTDVSDPAFVRQAEPFATIADLGAAVEEARRRKPRNLNYKDAFTDPQHCITCHNRGFHPEMARSGHAFLMKDGPDHGCAACHGPAGMHITSAGDPLKIVLPSAQRAADVNATCNACHANGRATEKWTCSEHSRQGVSCIECHDPNAPAGRTLRVPDALKWTPYAGADAARPPKLPSPRAAEFDLCGKCHLDVQAQFRLPNRHRVAEGRMGCSDCHDPHGNTDRVRDRDVTYRACLQCHQDKGGPFLYDHGIKRGEGCTACHDPHGSTNRRMLTFARVKPMCLQCHPETPHDLRRRLYDNCLACHTEIHGSHLDRKFLK